MMKRIATVLLLLVSGFLLGWLYGYAQPILQIEREFANNSEMAPDEIRAMMQRYRDIVAAIPDEERMTCVRAFTTLLMLEAGDLGAIKSNSVKEVAYYYHKYANSTSSDARLSVEKRELLNRIEFKRNEISDLNDEIQRLAEPAPPAGRGEAPRP